MKRSISIALAVAVSVARWLFDPLYRWSTAYMGRTGMVSFVSAGSTLTNLIPYMYEGLDIVSREPTSLINQVSRDSSAEQAALNQQINVPVVGAVTGGDIAPNTTPPDDGNFTPANVTLTIAKSRYWPIRWQAEEQKAVSQTGLLGTVQGQRFAQAIRAAVNELEADIAALHTKASRAYGTYNAQPFGTAGDFTDFTQVQKILDDNGAPGDRQIALSTTAFANLGGKQSVLFKANEAGTADLLRLGIMGSVMGMNIGKSAAIKQAVTAGTMANGTTNTAGYAVGATVLTLATAGTGVCVAGDIITIAGDTNKYVVKSVTFAGANPAAGDTITIAEPGLRVAIGTSATAITVTAATDRNMVFAKSAIAMVTRAPAMPQGGDAASDVMEIVDPVTGLAFQVAMYKQYRQVRYELGLAWGVQMIAPRHACLLIG